MPTFSQIQAVTVEVKKPSSSGLVETEEIELFALGSDGKVYRYSLGAQSPTWQVVE